MSRRPLPQVEVTDFTGSTWIDDPTIAAEEQSHRDIRQARTLGVLIGLAALVAAVIALVVAR